MNKTINKEKLLEALASLIEIPSVRDLSTKTPDAPFGLEIKKALDLFEKIAKSWGFRTKNIEGAVVYAEIGPKNDDYIGILGHVDVVDAGDLNLWNTDPFKLHLDGDMMYGRGVNDDKGPLLGALMAAKIAYESNPNMKLPIRVIAGGAEETTWECMDTYFKYEKQPLMAFSPDGNFPIVNGEKGILQLALTFPKKSSIKISSEDQWAYNCHHLNVDGTVYESDVLLSRNPGRGTHAVFEWLHKDQNEYNEPAIEFIKDKLLDDTKGYNLGIYSHDEEMGETSVSIVSLNTLDETIRLVIDIRYPKSTSKNEILSKFEHAEVTRFREHLFVNEDSYLIQSLQKAYENVMNEKANVLTKGGASYARVLKRGVAFGATFEGEDPRPHMPNERMPLSSLLKAINIYIESCILLSSFDNDKLPQ